MAILQYNMNNSAVRARVCLTGFILLSILGHSCRLSTDKHLAPAPRDTTITVSNSYNELFFDSLSMERFIKDTHLEDSMAQRMRNFYNSRNYQYAWYFHDGLTHYAYSFLETQNDYIGYSGDSLLYNPGLLQLTDSTAAANRNIDPNDSTVLKTELLLTYQFFRYANRAYQGNLELDVKELGWYIPRKKIDQVAMLDSVIRNGSRDISLYQALNRQYNLLKRFVIRYDSIERSGGWPVIKPGKKQYKKGDSAATIAEIKNRLFLVGDLPEKDTSFVFTEQLETAVKRFQQRFGLSENGQVNASTLAEMNIPVGQRIRQILINMERIRWAPSTPNSDYLLVNIPEFRLHVYESGNYKWSMNVVVGTAAHSTVIFTGTLKYVVFSPYWNVPPGILKNEVLPGIKKDPNYLARHNMEWNGGAVRQRPGPQNSLGLVKFLFPNNYNIYLHDTPSKSLFGESSRAFSHGCIRLAEPAKLARFLLRNDPAWDSVKIVKAMHAGKERFVTLKEDIPVFIAYFTSWVDREDKLHFRKDIYKHDKKMADHLFINSPKP